jgi:lysyl-tRNA synthetase class 1
MGEGHWIRGIVEAILARGDESIVIHTGKTPSGPIHIGAEREQFLCSAIQRGLEKKHVKSTFNFIIDSFDPLKSIPVGLEVPKGFAEHIGKPLSDVPDPLGCHGSYASHFAEEFIDCQARLGLTPTIIYQHKLYEQPVMKDAIRTVLRRLDELKSIRRRFIQGDSEEDGGDWNPVMVICQNCGKIASRKGDVSPNRLKSWDLPKDEVSYSCTSCGYKGHGKIANLRLKLSWRVDWPAKWAAFKVSCEPAGKDHCVKDGAYDMGLEICSKIFGYGGPLRVSYEWLTLGEHAMKTHKGITFTPMEWLRIAPPEPLRQFILAPDPMRHIAFLPERIPDIVDNFDRLERLYFGKEAPAGGEDPDFLRDLYELCVVGGTPEKAPARLPYRFSAYMVQLEGLYGHQRMIKKSVEYMEKLYGRCLLGTELTDVKSRLTMAKNWVTSYAPQNLRFTISETAPSYKPEAKGERAFASSLIELLQRDFNETDLQNEIFNAARAEGLEVGKAFAVVYRIILGSERGPRLAPLLMALDREWVLRRLRSAL